VAIDVVEVLRSTALQQNIPREPLSRVSSYDWLGSLASTPIALAGAGALAATIGLSGAIRISAALGAAGTWGFLDPQVRTLRAGRASAASSLPPV
jgi:hypothetical protein